MKISVALCTYNGTQYLALQLASIFFQTIPVNEIIVCDDGSEDDTLSIIDDFQKLHPGIIRFYQNEYNLGAKKNFEKAIGLTTGDFIFLSDQDDIWLPHKVSATLHFFENNIDAQAVFSNGSIIDEQGHEINTTIWECMGFSQKLRNNLGSSRIF
jgi:glycosyltransferase involved in cell wall biosynthesis